MTDAALTRRRAVIPCALLIIAVALCEASARTQDREGGRRELSFLSGADDQSRTGNEPAEPLPAPAPQGDNGDFDGVWTFTSGGCRNTGSLVAKIIGGRIIVKGGSGQVDRDGTLHSVGAGNGMTLTAVGQLSGGGTGSGTFNRSDGCVGSWIAIKRGPLNGRR
jgi:hypothetical protein